MTRRGPKSARPVAAAVAISGAVAVLAAGCSVPRTTVPTEESTPPRTYAMTGLPAPAGSHARPVLVVKIDNTAAGQPQRGVNSADMVIEEPVEGGLTRLAAFYESRLPESVGPVRSVRISDIGLVKPVAATVVASGGAPVTLTAFQRAGVRLVTEDSPALKRDPDRAMPYDLFADLTRVNRTAVGSIPRQPYFDFGQPQFEPGPEVQRVTITYSRSHTEEWRWEARSGTWLRADVGDITIATPTIIVASVRLRDAGYVDAAGSRVPVIDTRGGGNGFMLANGRVHPIAWQKDSETAKWQFSTRAGLVLPVPAGKVWLALIPRGVGRVRF